MTPEQLERIFTCHSPRGDQALRYQGIRDTAKAFAELLNRACPEGREKALAFTQLQAAVMWANAAIAIGEAEPQEQAQVDGQVAGKPEPVEPEQP